MANECVFRPTLALTPGIAAHHGRLMYLVGGKDKLIDAKQIEAIDAALTDGHVSHEVVAYPDAEHAFFWEGTEAFHRASRDDAWARVHHFFDGHVGALGVPKPDGTSPTTTGFISRKHGGRQ